MSAYSVIHVKQTTDLKKERGEFFETALKLTTGNFELSVDRGTFVSFVYTFFFGAKSRFFSNMF